MINKHPPWNETIYLNTTDYEGVRGWMVEITNNSSGWYIAGSNKNAGIVFCRDFPYDRDTFKTLIKLRWS